MGEGFRPLATVLRERDARRNERLVQSEPAIAEIVAEAPAPAPQSVAPSAPVGAFCSDLALARLAAREAFQRAAIRLLETFARDVLGRELALAPVDIASLVRRMATTFAEDSPLAVILAPADAEAVRCDLAVRTDPTLSPGDVVLVVQDGTVDARLALRLCSAVCDAVG